MREGHEGRRGASTMKSSVDYTLYLVTDRALMSTPTLEEGVEQAIRGGVTLVQLREKQASSLEFYQTALRVKSITDSYDVPLIINNRVDIALAVDAGGVHVGQSDLPAACVREILGPDKILGVSASSLEEALIAVEDGADYLGVGAMFATGTKTDADITTIEELKRIRQAVPVPIVVIGGINKHTLPCFAGTGIDGIAVVSAIIAAADVEAAARELKELFEQMK
jgi:thiamine-phosphate pyrophosphorylase